MKNTLKVLLLAAGILVVQACGSKKNKEATAGAPVIKKEVAITAADKRAKFEKQRAERAERRRIGYEKLCLNTPTYTDANGNLVYNQAESNPSFIGGDKALRTYLKDTVKFPHDALDKQEEGGADKRKC